MEIPEKEALKVLLVEDNQGDVFLFKFYLEEIDKEGYVLKHAGSLKEAISMLDQEEFDAVMLDLNLPDSSDLDTVRRMREAHPDEMVIVMTGLSDKEIGFDAVKMGAEDFLVKGDFDAPVLDSAIKFAHQRYSLRKDLKKRKAQFEYFLDRIDITLDLMDGLVFEYGIKSGNLEVIMPGRFSDAEGMTDLFAFTELFEESDVVRSAITSVAESTKVKFKGEKASHVMKTRLIGEGNPDTLFCVVYA